MKKAVDHFLKIIILLTIIVVILEVCRFYLFDELDTKYISIPFLVILFLYFGMRVLKRLKKTK